MHQAPYRIWTQEEAADRGYTPVEGLRAPRLKPFLEMMDTLREKAQWLRTLTRRRIAMLMPYLDLSPLRRSFIIVCEEDSPEYEELYYSLWQRDITRRN